MLASIVSTATRAAKPLGGAWPTRVLCGLLKFVFCSSALALSTSFAQVSLADVESAPAWSEARPDFVSDGRLPQVSKNTVFDDSVVVTANALRAPAKARAAALKAFTAMSKNQRGQAEEQIARALEIYPDYAIALTLRALIEASTQTSAAIADLEHAIRADPSFGFACALLANIYNSQERYDDALPLILRASRLLPSAWRVHFEMARTLFGQHQSIKALVEVNEAIRRVGIDKTARSDGRAALHFLRGQILLDQQDFGDAKLEFELTLKESSQGYFAQHVNQILARLESPTTQ